MVTRESAGFVLSFLRPPLVFPEARNLKVDNWVLSLKAASGEWEGMGDFPPVTLALGRHVFDGCLTAF